MGRCYLITLLFVMQAGLDLHVMKDLAVPIAYFMVHAMMGSAIVRQDGPERAAH